MPKAPKMTPKVSQIVHLFFIFLGLGSISTRNAPLDFKTHSKGELRASILAQSTASGPQNLSQNDLQFFVCVVFFVGWGSLQAMFRFHFAVSSTPIVRSI